MIREQLRQWFDGPQGQILIKNEVRFLNQAITLSYAKNILQLGCLGWEDQFIDCASYRGFFVIDESQWCCQQCAKIHGRIAELPIASDTIDMVILPHLLEFEAKRYQVLREVERVLKPEGELIILGFNPWSCFTLANIVRKISGKSPGYSRFISRSRMIDWLHMLNFEAEVVAGFDISTATTSDDEYKQYKSSFWVTAYAIHAIKRRFNIIPLQPHWTKSQRYGLVGDNVSVKTSSRLLRAAVSCGGTEHRNRSLHGVNEDFEHRPTTNGGGAVDIEQVLRTTNE
jgi:SAM-dependent methyltransferase